MNKYQGAIFNESLKDKILRNPMMADYYIAMDMLQKLPPDELRKCLKIIRQGEKYGKNIN